jgi:hypothetical protein
MPACIMQPWLLGESVRCSRYNEEQQYVPESRVGHTIVNVLSTHHLTNFLCVEG